MTIDNNRYHEEAAVLLVLGVGVVSIVITSLLSPVYPWMNPAWVFILLIALVLGATLIELPTDEEDSTGKRQTDDGGVVGVDLLDWANERVGNQCLACESEIKYIPLGGMEGESNCRIECGCTVIESMAKTD